MGADICPRKPFSPRPPRKLVCGRPAPDSCPHFPAPPRNRESTTARSGASRRLSSPPSEKFAKIPSWTSANADCRRISSLTPLFLPKIALPRFSSPPTARLDRARTNCYDTCAFRSGRSAGRDKTRPRKRHSPAERPTRAAADLACPPPALRSAARRNWRINPA